MLDEARHEAFPAGDHAEFCATGAPATGEYHCASCGYGVTVNATLPPCPMCAGTVWERGDWSLRLLARRRLPA